ncbi:hypothetical protein K402DRAFT_429950 [Aulographum hederae CBS 113979]|uniref:Uncharacterized protein n=1 Tax=Aulographum hederae CBS 113979 TaxID=1176131 RepID=A0A6G1H0N0_9PEZI|nr:hypothetical protein K402DRAFT_96931 [Aulographum hederae CBS 113979]KAF1986783.1 hypothetical protein K402DRAFT_429950 [Aulographum hederae CBS 113979]
MVGSMLVISSSITTCICPLRAQLPMHSTRFNVAIVIANRSHDNVRRAPEKVLSGSADYGGIERISKAKRLSLGYSLRLFKHH